MSHASAALRPLAHSKSPDNAALLVVLHKGQLHPVFVRAAAPEAAIPRIRRQRDRRRLCLLRALCALQSVSFVLNLCFSPQTNPTRLLSPQPTPRRPSPLPT